MASPNEDATDVMFFFYLKRLAMNQSINYVFVTIT